MFAGTTSSCPFVHVDHTKYSYEHKRDEAVSSMYL